MTGLGKNNVGAPKVKTGFKMKKFVCPKKEEPKIEEESQESSDSDGTNKRRQI